MELAPEDLKAAFEGPAIYVDRVMVMVGATVRLAFVEQTAAGPIFRAAVALPHQTAIEFAKILNGSLADVERQFAEAEAKAAAKDAK